MREKLNFKKIKSILVWILIGIVVFPTITFGSTFVSSLIQGKTVEEAVQILAGQIDSLIGRVEAVETKQAKQEETTSELQNIIDQQKALIEQLQLSQKTNETQITKNNACQKKYEIFQKASNIWGCTPGSDWWVGGQKEGTIDALIACLDKRMSEKPWLTDPSGGSDEKRYQDKLDQLNILNVQYKSAEAMCGQ